MPPKLATVIVKYKHLSIALFQLVLIASQAADGLGPSMSFQSGSVNAVGIKRNGKIIAVYRAAQPAVQLLITHHRRDVTSRASGDNGKASTVLAPAAEAKYFLETSAYWEAFWKKRFHYYAQQSTKILVEPVKVGRWVKGGDVVEWEGLRFEVLDTPGFTRGSVSYLTTIDGKRMAFTGDLIYGDGKIFDLYSFQDAIPEACVWMHEVTIEQAIIINARGRERVTDKKNRLLFRALHQ